MKRTRVLTLLDALLAKSYVQTITALWSQDEDLNEDVREVDSTYFIWSYKDVVVQWLKSAQLEDHA